MGPKPWEQPKLIAATTAAGLYCAWFAAVVQRGARSKVPWGSRWLSNGVSSILYRFGCWYLDFSVDHEDCIKRGVFDRNKQYMMVWHPHGKIFPRMFCACADLLFHVPLLAEYLLLCNARSCSSKVVSRILDTGATVALQPGGLHEQVHTDSTQEKVFFPARLGFVRLAIKHGVPLLPLYVFGENQLYDTKPWLSKINIWFYKHFKVGSLFMFSGLVRWLPVSPALPNPLCLPVPRTKLSVRIGEPVDVGAPDPEPSDAKVHEVYERYVASLQKVFDTHKADCCPPEVAAKGLKVILRGGKTQD